jgi:hypothetical protein
MTAAVQEPRPDAALRTWIAQAQLIKPTVTKEMGDVGGKLLGRVPDPAKTRHYYIAAEIESWDFAPKLGEVVCGLPTPELHTAMKIRYVQYTDETFTAKVLQTPRLGVLGPVLRGVVGEYLAVTFLNRTEYPLSMHPHGVKYDKDNEGAYYQPGPGLGAAVGGGAKFTYVWQLDEASGPLPGEPSSKGWLYHSHVNGDADANLGLVGFIIVTDPARARPDGTPNDVDREMASLFMVFSESGFDEAAEEAAETGRAVPLKTYSELQQELETGFRYAINGYIHGNLPGLEANEGERVRWYLFGLGDEVDMHTAHWHGLRVTEENRRRTDVVELLPASMKVADMLADNPGSWLFHCHVAEHMMCGMYASMVVHPRAAAGVSRAPEKAFLGLREAAQSLRLERAEIITDDAQKSSLRLRGKVAVFDAFSIFRTPVRLQIGEKSVSLTPDPKGTATVDGVTYRVLNGGAFGVVYGGIMEWEARLPADPWLRELEKLGVLRAGAPVKDGTAELKMQVGEANHTATIRDIQVVK